MLNKFCCCCSLRRGCYAVAYSYLAFLIAYLTKQILQHKFVDIEVTVSIFIDIFLTLLLAMGVHKKKWLCLVPWLVTQLIANATLSIYAVIFSFEEPFFLASLPFILLSFYFCLVVYSYVVELRREKAALQPINYAKNTPGCSTTVVMNPIWNENYQPPSPPPPYSKKDENAAPTQS